MNKDNNNSSSNNNNNNSSIITESSEIIKLVNSSSILYTESDYEVSDNSNNNIITKSLLSDDSNNSNSNSNNNNEIYDNSNNNNQNNNSSSNINIEYITNDNPGELNEIIYEKAQTRQDGKRFSIEAMFDSIKRNKKRIITVFLIINLGFPLFLSYNNPSSMVKIFKREYDIDSTQFGRLYSLYALPNVIMVFLGGILVDLIGTNKCSLIFSSILTISTILAAISSSIKSYGLLAFSRILLGLGGESLLVCVATFITDMFESNQVSLVMGIEATWVQFGSLVAFGVLPSFYNATSFPITMWFIAFIATAGTILNVIFIIYQPKLRFNKEQPIPLENIVEDEETITHGRINNNNNNNSDDNTLYNNDMDGATKLKKNNSFENHGRGEIDTRDLIQDNNNQLLKEDQQQQRQQQDNNNKSFFILFKENIIQAFHIVKTMSIRTWILTIVAFFGYSAFFGLDIIFTDMAIERYGYSDAFAAAIMASETFVTGIVSPLCGIMVKKLKRNILAMGIGTVITMLGIFLIVVTDVMPVVFVIMGGVGYTLMSNAIYSSVPLIVDEDSMGTAYGCIGTSYNIGIVIFPLFLTYFRSITGDYIISMWILILSSVLTIICLFVLKYYDNKELDIQKKLDRSDYNFIKYLKLK